MKSTLLRCLLASIAVVGAVSAEEPASLIARIKSIGKEGAGNVQAAKAWRELVGKGPDVALDVLGGLDDASPAAANWLRAAVDAVNEKAVQSGKPLPAAKLEAFVRDTRRNGAARRLAYDWLVRVDASAADRLIPKMLDDPGQELRRDAVAIVLKDAQAAFSKSDKTAALDLYKKALGAARDRDQVTTAADQLKKLGIDTDLTQHFGFVTRWMVSGPFDNVKGVGFHKAYPPESGVDLAATYVGKEDKKAGWSEHATQEKLGLVDLNKVVGPLKGAVVFGHAVVSSPEDRPVQIRVGSNNAIRLFLNGKEIFFREEYHHGMQMDQHIAKGQLKAGRNEILIKVCQNEQTESWAQQWSFQLRVCDDLGAAVPVTVLAEKSK